MINKDIERVVANGWGLAKMTVSMWRKNVSLEADVAQRIEGEPDFLTLHKIRATEIAESVYKEIQYKL